MGKFLKIYSEMAIFMESQYGSDTYWQDDLLKFGYGMA